MHTHVQERKELLAGNFKVKHFWWGSLILATGTGIAIEGAANTFIRTGKLFPGPHLYAGESRGHRKMHACVRAVCPAGTDQSVWVHLLCAAATLILSPGT